MTMNERLIMIGLDISTIILSTTTKQQRMLFLHLHEFQTNLQTVFLNSFENDNGHSFVSF